MDDIKELKKKIFLTAYSAGAAHLASSFSVIEMLHVLYADNYVRVDCDNPWRNDRDRLVLSKGHACLAQYVALNEIGIISDEMLKTFCKPGSCLGGEPKLGSVAGVEASTGSLGHGLSFAVGIALACKMNKYDNHIYVVVGDGELQEGSVWEAIMSAANHRLDNMTIIIDDNRLQAMDTVESIMGITSWKDKFEAFGYQVLCIDGHNCSEIRTALDKVNETGIPKVIISNTIKGCGISFMEGVPIWHYRMPNEDELRIVQEELNISNEELVNAKCIS